MKTFILTESVMNGTVAMDTITTVYQAKNFKRVVDQLKNSLTELNKNNKKAKASIENDDMRMFSYIIEGQTFPVWGYLANREHVIVEVF